MVPMAAFAPNASMSFPLPGLLLITVTGCPFYIKRDASGLLMFPNEPVSMIFILFFVDAKVSSRQKKDVTELRNVVGKMRKTEAVKDDSGVS